MDQSNQNPSHASIIGNCLSCKGLVRVPEKAPSTSKVRCPHCSESYALWQILDQAVPELELVDESAEPEVLPRVDQVLVPKEGASERQTFVVPSQLSKGARRKRRRRRSADSESPSNGARTSDSGSNSTFESISRQAEEDSSVREPSSRGSSSRSSPSRGASSRDSSSRSSRKPQRNQAAEILKVAIGGLLAIPIAYLLLFWVFKQDPLNVGPTIGQYVPFVVPAELRGPEVEPRNVDDDSGKRKELDPAEFDPTEFEDGEVALPILDVSPDEIANEDL